MKLGLPILLASLALGACSQGSGGFSGGGERTAAEQAECDADATTVAQLVTTEVNNNDDDAQIEYQITVTNCDGEEIQLEAKNIKFDIDGISRKSTTAEVLPYVAKAGETAIEGNLERVNGEDLFGKQGEKFFHRQTDKTLTLPEGTKAVTFIVQLKGASYRSREADAKTATDHLLPTYLAFGTAKVVRQDVHFMGLWVPAGK